MPNGLPSQLSCSGSHALWGCRRRATIFPLSLARPKLLLLVHQEFRSGKTNERRKIEVAISRACDQLAVPNSWIDLESISGPPEALFFDPFDSFEQLDTVFAE